MSNNRKVLYFLLTLLVVFFTPYIALYIKLGTIPEGFFHFPAIEATSKPQVNWLVITITSLLFLAFLLLLFVPSLFGFKRSTEVLPPRVKTKFPLWFWIGLVLFTTILFLFIGKFSEPKWIMNWALLPLWWGFILMLDGIVFSRNNGRSLVNNAPAELIAMGILSISGWLIFEYFNFFIELNWFYPPANDVDHDDFLLYAVVGSSAFIPMAFEWYHLFLTIPVLSRRYRLGKRIHYSLRTKLILLAIAFGLLVGLSLLPDHLFYGVWLGPLTILTIVLTLLGVWTPFQPIRQKGDWTPLILFALTWLVQGLLIESWNFFSYKHSLSPTYNPGYWDYCIPYVNIGKFFNMPLLGYLGYVPFSLYCCIWIYGMSLLMNIKLPFTERFN